MSIRVETIALDLWRAIRAERLEDDRCGGWDECRSFDSCRRTRQSLANEPLIAQSLATSATEVRYHTRCGEFGEVA